jgi:hypothetical protein
MLIWYQPKPNEVNFLPWLECYQQRSRRSRLYLYGATVAAILLGLGVFGWLYINLLQVEASLQQQVSDGGEQLQLQQRQVWAGSLESRRMEQELIIQSQQDLHSWLPVQELSRLLIILAPTEQLLSWQWQPILGGQQVVFAITGQGPWQKWWQAVLNEWPSIKMEALGPDGAGWKFEASYLLANVPLPLASATAINELGTFALQLTPQPLSVSYADTGFEAIANITRQITKYGDKLEIVHDQGVHIKMHLDSLHWTELALLPNAAGWVLTNLSIQQTSSEQWQVSMQWLPAREGPSLSFFRLPPSAAAQTKILASIKDYAQALQIKAVPTPLTFVEPPVIKTLEKTSVVHGKLQHVDDLKFIGYSQQQNQVSVAWVKFLSSGRLLRVVVGDQINGWSVSVIGAQGVHLVREQQVIIVGRQCLTGVCPND